MSDKDNYIYVFRIYYSRLKNGKTYNALVTETTEDMAINKVKAALGYEPEVIGCTGFTQLSIYKPRD